MDKTLAECVRVLLYALDEKTPFEDSNLKVVLTSEERKLLSSVLEESLKP